MHFHAPKNFRKVGVLFDSNSNVRLRSRSTSAVWSHPEAKGLYEKMRMSINIDRIGNWICYLQHLFDEPTRLTQEPSDLSNERRHA